MITWFIPTTLLTPALSTAMFINKNSDNQMLMDCLTLYTGFIIHLKKTYSIESVHHSRVGGTISRHYINYMYVS